jgi:hypothetical protein
MHREEAADLAERVLESSVRLVSLSYRALWEEWEKMNPPAHLPLLRHRYDREV